MARCFLFLDYFWYVSLPLVISQWQPSKSPRSCRMADLSLAFWSSTAENPPLKIIQKSPARYRPQASSANLSSSGIKSCIPTAPLMTSLSAREPRLRSPQRCATAQPLFLAGVGNGEICGCFGGFMELMVQVWTCLEHLTVNRIHWTCGGFLK